MNEVLLQAIGFIAVMFFIISYQMKSNRVLFLFQLIGCLIFCLQFTLMGAYTGALSLLVNILRNTLLLKAEKWAWVRSNITLAAIIALLILITACTWAGWISLLPFFSVAITSIGYWTNDPKEIRYSQLVGSPCTLIYDCLIHSWGGAISETVTIISIIVSIKRFGWAGSGKENSKVYKRISKIQGGTKMRITKNHIMIAAIVTVILAVISFLTFNNEAIYNVAVILTELSLLGFMALHITYIVPEKSFR